MCSSDLKRGSLENPGNKEAISSEQEGELSSTNCTALKSCNKLGSLGLYRSLASSKRLFEGIKVLTFLILIILILNYFRILKKSYVIKIIFNYVDVEVVEGVRLGFLVALQKPLRVLGEFESVFNTTRKSPGYVKVS